MFCNTRYTDDFLFNTFSAKWMSQQLRVTRQKLLVDMEMAKIPDTQRFCDVYRRFKSLTKKKQVMMSDHKTLMKRIDFEIRYYNKVNADIVKSPTDLDVEMALDIKTRVYELSDETQTLKKRIANVTGEISTLDAIVHGLNDGVTPVKNVVYKFPCPRNECRGFVSRNRCEVCQTRVCEMCRSEAAPSHMCDPDALLSLSAITNDSKPCPKCKSMIFRISGCPQMFCTICKNAFDWNTGESINNRSLQNPHFFDWLRNGRTPPTTDDADHERCGNSVLQDVIKTVSTIRQKFFDPSDQKKLIDFVRTMLNTIEPVPEAVFVDKNRDIRLGFVSGDMTLSQFKSVVGRRDTEARKKRSIRMVHETFRVVSNDLVVQVLRDFDLKSFETQAKSIIEFSNDALARIELHNGVKIDKLTPL
jgi:hypothetical protein